MMLKKTTLWLLSVMMLLMMLVAGCGGGEGKKAANDSQKLIVYTSMKESLIKGIVDGFKKANPGIDVDYQSAGAGKLMAKIAAERQSGKILADVIWTSEVPDFRHCQPGSFRYFLHERCTSGKTVRLEIL